MYRHKILIVDDEKTVLSGLSRLLQDDRYEVIACESAEEAAEVLNKNRISMIICDYKLKDMNGIDFLENVTQEKPGIINILLSGQTEVRTVAEAVNRLSLQGFITKPWDDGEVRQMINNSLEKIRSLSLKQVKARDIMSEFAITVDENASLTEAAHLLMRFKISGMPVIGGSGELTGIITATDLFRIMGETADNFHIPESGSKVKDVMTKNVKKINTGTSLIEIIHIMHGKDIHTLPVMDEGEIKGIVGRRDVFYKYYRLLAGIKD